MKTALLLASAFTLAAAAAQAGAPATGGPYMTAATRGPAADGPYNGAYASGPTGDRGTDSQLRDGRVRCQRLNGRLMLVNVSGTTFPAHASLRYALGKAPAHTYQLRAPLPAGEGISLPEAVGDRFDCAAAVRF
ncbi:MAG: hypothetical protein JSR45_13340 [Proteobacteria bacterium]|nr:hypothetical protein [Pseudomonadota bacterium]